jgi:TolB protein
MNADGSNPTNLTNHPAFDGAPAWSPNGQRIAYHSNRDGNFEIYVMNADGSDETRLTDHPNPDFGPRWGHGRPVRNGRP